MFQIPQYYGVCRCGGKVIRDWGGVQPQFHCLLCGIVTSTPGHGAEFASKQELDDVLHALGSRSALLIPFMQTVEHTTGKCVRITDLVDHYNVKDGKIWIVQN